MSMEKNARATKKQQLLLEFVAGFIREHGYGPSYREIMNAIGYKSVSTVAIHINGLIAKGFLARTDNSPRSLEVLTMNETSSKPRDTQLPKTIVQLVAETLPTLEDVHDKQALIRALELLGETEAAQEQRKNYDV